MHLKIGFPCLSDDTYGAQDCTNEVAASATSPDSVKFQSRDQIGSKLQPVAALASRDNSKPADSEVSACIRGKHAGILRRFVMSAGALGPVSIHRHFLATASSQKDNPDLRTRVVLI